MITEDTKTLLKFTSAAIDPADIFNEAKETGMKAVDEYHKKHGEPFYCGFGNVVIRPAKGSFVKYLKENNIGSKNWNGGWSISSYDIMRGHWLCGTQSMSIKEEACEAFAQVLEKYGINANWTSRAD